MSLVDPPSPAAERARLALARRTLLLLFLANLVNYVDRAIPVVLVEPIALEFGLDDARIGLLSSAFVVVLAVAGLPLGRLADRVRRTRLTGWALVAWSVCTAATAASWNFTSLLVARVGVGVGEAGFGPAATSLLADLYRPAERARATGVLMLGLPVGLLVAYLTVGALAEALGGWRAPFLLAAVPGLLLAVFLLRSREPARGAAEDRVVTAAARPVRALLRVPTVRWLVLAGVGFNFAAYAVTTFTVPLLQRWFGLPLGSAAAATGVIVGLTGLIALTAGAAVADRAFRRSARSRVLVGAIAVGLSVPLAAVALLLGPGAAAGFTAVFAAAWLLAQLYIVISYPTVHDVVEPGSRGTAVAVLLALQFLLGGAGGPLAVGLLSDALAAQAAAGGATADAARAAGLHGALLLVPAALLVCSLALVAAATTVERDRARMLTGAAGERP